MPFSFDDAIPVILYSLGWRILDELQEKSKTLKHADCSWDSADIRAHNELIPMNDHKICLFEYSNQIQWIEVNTPSTQSSAIHHIVTEMINVIDRVVAQSNIKNSNKRPQVFSRPHRNPIEQMTLAGRKTIYAAPQSTDKKLGLSMLYYPDSLFMQPMIKIWFVFGAYTPKGRNADLNNWADLSRDIDHSNSSSFASVGF